MFNSFPSALHHARRGLYRARALYRAGANGPSSPEAPPVAGYVIWLNSEQGLFQDAAGTIPIAPNTRVARWEDQSGHGNHALDQGVLQQGFPAWPLYRTDVPINNKPVLLWGDVSKQRLASAGNVDLGNTGLTLFCVATFLPGAESWRTLFAFNGPDLLLREQNQYHRIESYHNSSGAGASEATAFLENTPYVFAFRFSDALNQLRTYRNGAIAATVADNGAMPAPARYALGGRMDDGIGSFFHGYMAELIAYPFALSDADVGAVQQWLAAKYALS